jgi:hypothetical protein
MPVERRGIAVSTPYPRLHDERFASDKRGQLPCVLSVGINIDSMPRDAIDSNENRPIVIIPVQRRPNENDHQYKPDP